jgi:ABC-type antimicrobial peptide transport system permease subunit
MGMMVASATAGGPAPGGAGAGVPIGQIASMPGASMPGMSLPRVSLAGMSLPGALPAGAMLLFCVAALWFLFRALRPATLAVDEGARSDRLLEAVMATGMGLSFLLMP